MGWDSRPGLISVAPPWVALAGSFLPALASWTVKWGYSHPGRGLAQGGRAGVSSGSLGIGVQKRSSTAGVVSRDLEFGLCDLRQVAFPL